MKNVAEYYDKTATGWSEEFLNERKESEILRKFCKCFMDAGTDTPRILDIGCGAGYDEVVMSRHGAKVLGIDISEKLVAIAKKKAATCKFVVGDIREDMSALGAFDGISCLATLIHISVQDMKKVFDNMANVLKKGGLLLVSSKNGSGKDIERSFIKIDSEEYDRNLNSYSAEELCNFAHPKFKLVDTWRFKDFSEGWRYYVFMKQ